jgi:hypothetical protein
MAVICFAGVGDELVQQREAVLAEFDRAARFSTDQAITVPVRGWRLDTNLLKWFGGQASIHLLRVAIKTEPLNNRHTALLMQSGLVRNLVHAVLAAQEQWLEVEGLPRQLLDEAGGFQGSDLARHLLFDKAKGSGASRDLGRRFALQLAALALVSSRRFLRIAVLQEVQGRRTEYAGPAFQGVRSLVLEAFKEVCQQRIGALQ